MTIAATITAKQYTGNGVTTQFAFPNKIFAAADLVVTIIDNLGNQYPFVNFANVTLGLTYTVQGVDVDTGAIVVLSGPLTNLWTIDIRSLIPDLQSTSIKNQGSFFPELHEEAFDRATRMIQDLLRLTYLFGIHGPDTETVPWPALPGPSVRKGMASMFDAITGLPTIGVPNTQTITTGLLAPFLGLAQTLAESNAGVTPVNLAYPPGNLLRYGTNTTPGTTDMSGALVNALKSNDYVYIPAGTYLINAEILVNRGNITIEGANQGRFQGGVPQGGTVLVLGAGAGVSGSCLRWGASLYGSVFVQNLAIQLPGGAATQIGLRFGQIINGRVDNVIVQGQGVAGDDTTAIQFDGLGTYTGDFDVTRCNLPNNKIGINLLGTITTLRILGNEIGGTSAGGVAGSIGVNISASTMNGVLVADNSIQQMHDGIINLGVGSRIGPNRYEGNTNNCTNTHSANLQAMLFGSHYANGPAAVYPNAVVDQMMVFERNICFVGGTYIESGLGFREKLRNFNAGEFLTPTFAAGNFTSNAGTWVVASATTYESTIVGKKCTVLFYVAGTATGAGSELRIAIPQQTVNGTPVVVNAAQRTRTTIHVFQNAAYAIGLAEVQVGDAFIRCYKDSTLSGGWTNGDCEVFGQITFEIQ